MCSKFWLKIILSRDDVERLKTLHGIIRFQNYLIQAFNFFANSDTKGDIPGLDLKLLWQFNEVNPKILYGLTSLSAGRLG